MDRHAVPPSRIRIAVDVEPDRRREVVVYWMIGARRASFNFALDRAVEHARALDLPLLVFEPLRAGHRWASERLHGFVVDGMKENAAAFAASAISYFPYVEPVAGAGKGLLAALARRAAVVITDEALGFFQPRMIEAAARALAPLGTRLEVVDGNGLLPLSAAARAYPTAYAFRRALQRSLPAHLRATPRAHPFDPAPARWYLPVDVVTRWPAADLERLDLAALPIDHAVKRAPDVRGGTGPARAALARFLDDKLARYGDRSHPDLDAASGLSPWLHFGHLSVHEVFARLAKHERWDPSRAGGVTDGSKEGFWNMSPEAEAFLDELVTWRELAHNGALHLAHFDDVRGLPAWAAATLAAHAADPRPQRYSFDELEAARTHDVVWNAAERQLVASGTMHNYLRMLWGKKVLAWSATPAEAFATLVELNNKYAVDGRDPNSYAGIAWCFGRYDRPWPARPIFGAVRAMSSESTARKLKLKGWLARWSAPT